MLAKFLTLGFIKPGTENFSKDSVTKHVKSDHQKTATYIKLRKNQKLKIIKKMLLWKVKFHFSFVKLLDKDKAGRFLKISIVISIVNIIY